MAKRKKIDAKVEAGVLTKSRRRCALCAGINHDFSEKLGQIAHIDRDPENSSEANLAFLCFEHHDRYDSKTSQSKGITELELRTHLAALLASETGHQSAPHRVGVQVSHVGGNVVISQGQSSGTVSAGQAPTRPSDEPNGTPSTGAAERNGPHAEKDEKPKWFQQWGNLAQIAAALAAIAALFLVQSNCRPDAASTMTASSPNVGGREPEPRTVTPAASDPAKLHARTVEPEKSPPANRTREPESSTSVRQPETASNDKESKNGPISISGVTGNVIISQGSSGQTANTIINNNVRKFRTAYDKRGGRDEDGEFTEIVIHQTEGIWDPGTTVAVEVITAVPYTKAEWTSGIVWNGSTDLRFSGKDHATKGIYFFSARTVPRGGENLVLRLRSVTPDQIKSVAYEPAE